MKAVLFAVVVLLWSSLPCGASDWDEEKPLDDGFEMPVGIPIHFRDVPLGVSFDNFHAIKPKDEGVQIVCSGDQGTEELFRLILPAHQKTFGKSCTVCAYADSSKKAFARVPISNFPSSVTFDFIKVADEDVLVEVSLRLPCDAGFYVQRDLKERYGTPSETNIRTGIEYWGNSCSIVSLQEKTKANTCDVIYRLKSKKEQNLPGPPSGLKRFGVSDL